MGYQIISPKPTWYQSRLEATAARATPFWVIFPGCIIFPYTKLSSAQTSSPARHLLLRVIFSCAQSSSARDWSVQHHPLHIFCLLQSHLQEYSSSRVYSSPARQLFSCAFSSCRRECPVRSHLLHIFILLESHLQESHLQEIHLQRILSLICKRLGCLRDSCCNGIHLK